MIPNSLGQDSGYVCNFIVARYTFGPLPISACWIYDTSANVLGLCMILVSDEIILLKLLLASIWKNTSELNEDFVMFFTKAFCGLFSLIYTGKGGERVLQRQGTVISTIFNFPDTRSEPNYVFFAFRCALYDRNEYTLPKLCPLCRI